MAWSPDGKTLVTGADRVLYFWDITVSTYSLSQFGVLRTADWAAENDSNGTVTALGPDQRHPMET